LEQHCHKDQPKKQKKERLIETHQTTRHSPLLPVQLLATLELQQAFQYFPDSRILISKSLKVVFVSGTF
jgi:hypothetical protein